MAQDFGPLDPEAPRNKLWPMGGFVLELDGKVVASGTGMTGPCMDLSYWLNRGATYRDGA